MTVRIRPGGTVVVILFRCVSLPNLIAWERGPKRVVVWEVRTVRPVLFAWHTDRFIIENDETNSCTEAESEMSLKPRTFLHRVNDQVRKRQYNLQKMQQKTATNTL